MPTTLVLSSTSNIQKSTKSTVLTSIQFTELSSAYTMTSTIVPTIVLPDSADNYASVGGATRHTVVVVSVSQSVCLSQRFLVAR